MSPTEKRKQHQVSEDGGVWTIKTSTTLKTMELKFKVIIFNFLHQFYIHLKHAKECRTCLINPFPLLIGIIQGSKSILTILQFVEPWSVLKETNNLIFCNHDLESERFSNCLNFKALKKSKALKFQTSLVECSFVCNLAAHTECANMTSCKASFY